MHYLDVMGGGHFSNDPDLVEALVTDAPRSSSGSKSSGVMFDKRADGAMSTIHGGGTSRKRMHSARDYSGAEIMRVLRDEVRSRAETIRVLEFNPAVELLTDGQGRVTGAVLLDLETREYKLVQARAVILATGGGGRLHYQGFPTTNHYGATADGLVLAYRVGGQPGVPAHDAVSPDRRRLPGADPRPTGDREGPRAGRAGVQRLRRAVRVSRWKRATSRRRRSFVSAWTARPGWRHRPASPGCGSIRR